ncbi:MAG: bifunctional precorrin-2 dehydrogenase/sirohydrochlorin ferrochelatase [Candidatus Zixiibacteriota bacterium]|nr:MAG: bifunctional precorrin-2 dehydrogenase/sirohydrochlorin ferrochelatase [candidate division Zixibacteria bacterium]
MAHAYMPIGLSLKKRSCLVVGGGKVALRKVNALLDYDTEVTIVAVEPHEKIEYFAAKGLVKLEKRAYQSPEAQSYGIVISASNDGAVNETVHADCKKAGVPINVVDNPGLCDFIFPAVVRRGCISVSVSSDGKAPFLSGHLKLILENLFSEARWEKIAGLAADFRARVHKRWPDDHEKRSAAIAKFLESDWKELLRSSTNQELSKLLDEMLDA